MLYPYVLMSADDDCRLADERIEFAFEWTERDIVAAYLWNVLHPSTGTCLAFLCAGAVAAVVGGFGRGSATALVTQAVALGGALWLLLAILDLLWLLLVRMRSDTWRRRCMGRQMLELTPTVVTWQNAIAAERMAWADVPGVSQGVWYDSHRPQKTGDSFAHSSQRMAAGCPPGTPAHLAPGRCRSPAGTTLAISL